MSGSEDIVERAAAKRRELEALARDGQHERAGAVAIEAVALVGQLRAAGQDAALAVDAAERVLSLLTELARVDALRYLPALGGAIEELGHCYQRGGQYERAAAAFASAIELLKIRAAVEPDSEFARIELMSSRALALAQAGQIEQAYELAGELVVLAREQLPRALPLLTGGLAFMADLAGDLGRRADAVAHLVEGMRVLERAVADELPGARQAAERLAERLAEARERAGTEPG